MCVRERRERSERRERGEKENVCVCTRVREWRFMTSFYFVNRYKQEIDMFTDSTLVFIFKAFNSVAKFQKHLK